MNILLSFVSLILVIIIMKILKLKFPNMTNIVLISFLTVLLVQLLNSVFKNTIPEIWHSIGGILSFLYFLIYAGINEELCKFIGIKLSKPKNNSELLVNAILIACLFGVIENVGYLGLDISNKSLFFRMINMHMLFQVIMANIIVKGIDKNKKGLFTIISLVITMFIHGLWDYINNSDIIIIIGGIICYTLVIYTLFKAKKIQDTIPQIEENKDKLFTIKFIAAVIISLFWLFIFTNSEETRTKLNDTCSIEYIDIKVLEAKTVQINGEEIIKIKVSLKNNSDNTTIAFTWDSFSIVDLDNGESDLENSVITLYDVDKRINDEIEPNGENIGYIYFNAKKDIKKYKLSYKNIYINKDRRCNMSLS